MTIKTPPIGFTEPNFCAVLQGIKTETRRLLTVKGATQKEINNSKVYCESGDWFLRFDNNLTTVNGAIKLKSRLQIGDRAYLKEPTQIESFMDERNQCLVQYFWHKSETTKKVLTNQDLNKINERKTGWYSKQSQMFMLKSFARYHVEITDVRIERLMDITEESAIAEGVKYHVNRGYLNGNLNYEYPLYWDYMTNQYSFKSPVTSYLSEIAAIHKSTKDKIGGYDLVDSNPWLWVYKFKLIGAE